MTAPVTDEPRRATEAAAPVVHLHVGAPKTGTTLLQDVLFNNRERLRSHGVLVPGRHRQSHFHATIDLLDMSWGGLLGQARGSWEELVAEIAAWPGQTIVSNENLAVADDAAVARIRAALPGHDLRVVYSARDLARQIPAAWQEKVKHFYTGAYAGYVRQLRDGPDEEEVRRFWQRQTWPDVLARWTRELAGPGTLVTVPPPDQDPGLLLARFLEAFGLHDDWVPERAARSNHGLGPVESELLRTVQIELDGRSVKSAVRHTALRGALLGRWWASRPSEGRLALPAEALDWVGDLSDEWVEQVKATDVRVVGDLQDLVSAAASATAPQPLEPAAVTADRQLGLAVVTVADALEEVADLVAQRKLLTEERDRLRADADQVRIERDALLVRVAGLERTRWQSAKQRLVAAVRSHPVLGLAYGGYRRLPAAEQGTVARR